MKLELKKFDPGRIKNDSVVVFIGKRNTGKSFCMKDILSHNRDIPVGVVVSQTERANGYFEKFIPKMLIYDELEEKLISKFLTRQINITNERKRDMAKHGNSAIDPRAFLILDDCMYNKSAMTDKINNTSPLSCDSSSKSPNLSATNSNVTSSPESSMSYP